MAINSLISTTSNPGGTQQSAGTNFLQNLNLTDGNNAINNFANKFIARPKNVIGGAAFSFVFDYEGETKVDLQAEITDHYTETNDFVVDHEAHKPIRVTLRGYVGELVMTQTGLTGLFASIQNKLTELPSLLGKYTPGAVQTLQGVVTSATSVVNQVDNAIGRAKTLIGMFPGMGPAQTKQQAGFMKLYASYLSGSVFALTTPYTTFPSMVIEHVMAVQDETTKTWSDISITLKEVRFADAAPAFGMTQAAAIQNNSGRAAYQSQAQTILGKSQGTPFKFNFSSFGHVQGPAVGSFANP